LRASHNSNVLKLAATLNRNNPAQRLTHACRKVTKLLKDPDANVRSDAASALEALGPLPPTILPSLSGVYYFNHAEQDRVRFLCYYVTGGDPSVRSALQWPAASGRTYISDAVERTVTDMSLVSYRKCRGRES
jgi:hypothetical protein